MQLGEFLGPFFWHSLVIPAKNIPSTMKNLNDLQQKGHLSSVCSRRQEQHGSHCTMTTGSGYSSYSPKKFGVCCYKRLPLFGTPSQTQGLEIFLSTALQPMQPLGFETHCCAVGNRHPWS